MSAGEGKVKEFPSLTALHPDAPPTFVCRSHGSQTQPEAAPVSDRLLRVCASLLHQVGHDGPAVVGMHQAWGWGGGGVAEW